MSDITRRDVKALEEDADILGAIHGRVKAFGDRLPHGEALRAKVREYEAAVAEADGKGEAVRRQIEADGNVRA